MRAVGKLALRGPAGESVDLRRVLDSHGVASLAPNHLDLERYVLETTAELNGRAQTIRISEAEPGFAQVETSGPGRGAADRQRALALARHLLRLDEDLSGFYERAAKNPELSWVTSGAGRMLRSPTVFEDVVKTICTTNTSWGGTTRMVNALIEHLGVRAPGAPLSGPFGRAFPTAQAMAAADHDFYRRVAGAGYRGAYLRALATSVADGSVDLEALGAASPEQRTDDQIEEELRALPGVGPYAAAHVMLMLGRTSRLILDSWTRPTYTKLVGRRRPVSDRTIVRRFRPYGRYAGLAFWLFLTRDWLDASN
jgi:N-glycosylase/DNA lyase